MKKIAEIEKKSGPKNAKVGQSGPKVGHKSEGAILPINRFILSYTYTLMAHLAHNFRENIHVEAKSPRTHLRATFVIYASYFHEKKWASGPQTGPEPGRRTA